MISGLRVCSTSSWLRPVTTNNDSAAVIELGSRPAFDTAVFTASRPDA
jgi:hypothetical protein